MLPSNMSIIAISSSLRTKACIFSLALIFPSPRYLSYGCSLEQLHLNRNKLRHIYYPLDQQMTGSDFSTKATSIRPFECLQCLLIGNLQYLFGLVGRLWF